MFIAIALVLFIVLAVLLYITRTFRLDLEYRRIHIRQVLSTIVFVIISAFGFGYILNLVNKILSIAKIRDFLFSITPLDNVLSTFYFTVTMLVNIIFLTAFIVVLAIVNLVWLNAVKNKVYSKDYLESEDSNFIERFFNKLSDIFYDGNTLKPIGEVVGAWIRGMKRFFGVFLIAEFVLFLVANSFKIPVITDAILSNIAKNFFLLPMAAFVILQQVEIFLCGDRRIDDGLVGTDSLDETVIGDYMPLVKMYESVYGDGALISYYLNNGEAAQKDMYIGVTAEQRKNVKDPELLDAIYRNIEHRVGSVSGNFIDALVELINGKSVCIVDSMYGEFNFYYLPYLQHCLSLDKKAMVICDDGMQVESMVRTYKDIFTLINKATHFWRVGDTSYLRDNRGNIDVLICTEEELLDGRLKHMYPAFFEKVTNVNVTDTYAFMARDKAFLTRLFDYIDEKHNIQYVFNVEENNSDIKTAIEQVVKADVVVYENKNENNNVCIMYWKGESAYKTQLTLSPNLVNDFGVAFTIAAVAANYEVNDINIQAPATIPIYSYENTATGEYTQVLSRDFFKREAISLENVVSINDRNVFNTNELKFNIVYDVNNNLLTLTHLWLSYSGKVCSLIHIISRKYLLRDYFALNYKAIGGNSSETKKFVPIKVLNIKAATTAFLIRTRRGVNVQEILAFGYDNCMEEKNAEAILNKLLCIALEEERDYDIYSIFAFDLYSQPTFENNQYNYNHIVRMTDESLFDRLCELTVDNAVFKSSIQEIPLSFHNEDIYNYYLPNQLHSFGGIRYKINNIDDGVVFGTKDESIPEEKEYTNLYNIDAVENVEEVNKVASVETERYTVKYYVADVTRSIWGYLEHSNGIDFGDNNNTELYILPEKIVETKDVNYIDIKFNFKFADSVDKVATTLMVIVRGLLETLLPRNYKNLLVFSKINKDNITKVIVERDESLVDSKNETNDIIDDERLLHLFPDISSDAIESNGYDNVHLYIVDFSAVETGSVAAIANDINRIVTIMKQYILWDVTRDEKDSYLSFGLAQRPVLFDIAKFSDWVTSIAPKENIPEKVFDKNLTIAQARPCAFCGRPILGSGILLDDGRAMCQNCASHRATSKKEVTELLKRAYNLIESTYGVKVPAGIKIKFARQEELNKDIGYGVLGYYSPSKHLIKILRGGPEANILATLVHELTHAWQWREGNVGHLDKVYKEGHSTYVEIECLRVDGYHELAEHMHQANMKRQDEYGEGYRFWLEKLKNESDKNIFHQIIKMK